MKAFVFTVFLAAVSLSSTVTGRPSSPSELRKSLDHSNALLRRHSRGVPNEYDEVQEVSVAIFTNSSERCDQGLTRGGVSIQLEYRSLTLNENENASIEYSSPWKHLEYFEVNSSVSRDGYRRECVATNVNTTAIRWIQFRLRQLEHGGGGCSCWSACDFRVGGISVDLSIADNQCYIQQGGRNSLWRSHQPPPQMIQLCATLNETNQPLLTFCGGSSSVVRGIVSRLIDLDPPEPSELSDVEPVLFSNCTSDDQLVDVEDEADFTGCNGIQPRIEMRFQLRNDLSECDRLDHRDEGVEVSFGNWNGSGEWIPIHFFVPNNNNTTERQSITIGETINATYIVIRGHRVPYGVGNTSASNSTTSLSVCGEQLRSVGQMQFRWLQTVWQNNKDRDVWSLDNVRISLWYNDTEMVLVDEDFQTFNDSLWNIRGGRWVNNTDSQCSTPTEDVNPGIAFGFEDPLFPNDINSRLISTTPIDVETLLEGVTSIPTVTPSQMSTVTPSQMSTVTPSQMSTATPSQMSTVTPSQMSTVTPSQMSTVTPSQMSTATPSQMSTVTPSPMTDLEQPVTDPTTTTCIDPRVELLKQEEDRVLKIILGDPELYAVYISSAVEAAEMLEEVVQRRFNSEVDIDETVVVYLLGTIFNNASSANVTDPEFSESIVQIASGILKRTDPEDNTMTTTIITGSTLLRQLDNFALNVFDNDSPIQTDMIEHHVVMESTDNDTSDLDDMISVIQVEGAEIMLPRQLLSMFGGQGAQFGRMKMRVGSFFYRNMSGLLPESLEDCDDAQLASPVISTALQCEDQKRGRCPTEGLELDQPVRITIIHAESIKQLIEASNTTEISCIFWDFFEREGESILSTGAWSTSGCSRNDNLSTSAMTVCECNHLTNFAILLSATGTRFSESVTFSLQIIGYIGVSISLVAMVITVGIFIFFKSLWSMRSYIHINLCVNLFISQLIFIAGIEPRLTDNQDYVPVGCQVVAVLLHYFFLVTFMWMLMEGVVLYVVLVRVFVKYHKRYIIAFTVVSYGLPLLYMCALTLPLGFALSDVSGYGYSTACFLNPDTKFIWAFTTPVILTILVNIGFFIMAIFIMSRHQRRQTNKSTIKNVKHWLKASISLLVVMGITWLMGVLVLNVNALLPVAYIFTILVAFQGVFIFFLFVVFSKQVQEACSKWWKSKVVESEFLSRHFGEKSIANSTRMTGMRSVPSPTMEKSSHEAPSTSGIEKDGLAFELEQSTKLPLTKKPSDQPPVLEKEKEGKKGTLQRQGTTFEVTLVPVGSLENLANDTHYDSDRSVSLTNGTLVNRPTAVPNDYQCPNEFTKPNSTSNSHQV